MFTRILVPLDGSRLAEASLGAAAYLAKTLNLAVTLVHVIEHNAPEEIHGEPHLTSEEDARVYLDEVARRAFPAGVAVDPHVHTSEVKDVAASIVNHVQELKCDMVVMCTHGQGGLRSWLFGNIAQQVIRLGKTPVLLIEPRSSGEIPAFICQRLLVALDGNPDHEQGLPVAIDLARGCQADIHLVMVVPTRKELSMEQAATAMLLPGSTSALLDLTEAGAREYLSRHVSTLSSEGIQTTAEVRRGDPAKTIIRTARRVGADLIVLGTHGKTGMDAFWSGSLTPLVSSRSHLPLMLVPVTETGTELEQSTLR
ncbi:MAG TPA: universal stress protein [Anaerolineales bacterium]|nr:universal stress protein [Anaerolineales bacterium]